ncbi:hypothetical protein MNZ22_05010 [Aeromonas encheleia]|nr:hypothetical protein [Aeromonas encheleia]UNP89718.1 hypothetical protein MNZ22_05010 [Aeromonas encheleia]
MTQAVELQPDQPLIPSPHPDIETTDTKPGNMVQLDVIDLAAPDDDY